MLRTRRLRRMRRTAWTGAWLVCISVFIVPLCLLAGCGGTQGGPTSSGQPTSLEPCEAREFVTWPTEAQLRADLVAAGKSVDDVPVLISGANARAGIGEEVRPAAYMYEPPFGVWVKNQTVLLKRTSWYEKNLYSNNLSYTCYVRSSATGIVTGRASDADLYVYAPIRGLGTGLKLVGYSLRAMGQQDAVRFRPRDFGGVGWFVFAVYGYAAYYLSLIHI